MPQFPELPTIAESGLPGYQAVSWFGLFAPVGTPASIVRNMNADVQRILADPTFQEKFLTPNFFEPIVGSEHGRHADLQAMGYSRSVTAVDAVGNPSFARPLRRRPKLLHFSDGHRVVCLIY